MNSTIRLALPVLSAVLLFQFRNLLRVPVYVIQGRPIRIDVPLPYLQLDVVLVSSPQQIQVDSVPTPRTYSTGNRSQGINSK